jgi:hypothetical protein
MQKRQAVLTNKDFSRMKAKVIHIFDTTGLATAYWSKFIGKTYQVVRIIAKNNGDSIYHLDMGKDGIKIWYANEIELIDDGEPLQPVYAGE